MGGVPTRTPEGEPARCPVCDRESRLVASAYPTPDATCPRCGHLLWLSGDPGRETGGKPVRRTARHRIGVDETVAEMERAIQQAAERLRAGQPEAAGTPAVEGDRTVLALREMTDPVEIRLLELAAREPGAG